MCRATAMKSKFWIIGALLFATRLEAGPVDLTFAPPAVPAQTICHKSRGSEAARATWAHPSTDWPRDLSTSEIRLDIKALRDLNAVEFLPVILSIINGLAERDPSYRGKHATLAEIEARLAAGDLQALRDRHLVAQLAAQSTGSSAQITWALARYFRDGIGVEQDTGKADAYLVLAAEIGHPEALMTLAQRQLAETAPKGWDAPAEATMRRGLERLLGPLNSGVCDRAGRIARLYLEGRGLRADAELAQAWWRFAADLGDAQAAWTVYELQSQAELVTPDTTIRLAYLNQAADAGLPYAQVALGRVYERGALVPRDLQAAFDLYQRVAQTGDRAGMIRLTLFLQNHAAAFPEQTPLKISMLQHLADRDDAPGWVYTRLATHSVHTAGRWGDLAAQWALLGKAKAAGDRDGMSRLVELLLADRTDPAHFDQALALLGELVTVHGSTGAAKKLHDAHMCRAPDSPRVPEAQFWKAQYLASDPPLPQATQLGQDPLAVAAVQAQALSQRRSALRLWFVHLAPQERHFWSSLSNGYDELVDLYQTIEANPAWSATEKQEVAQLAGDIFATMGAGAADDFVQGMDLPPNAEKTKLLSALAAQGNGLALKLLLQGSAEPEVIWRTHLLATRTHGDFKALLLALPRLPRAERAATLDRAIAVMPCDYKGAIAVAQAAGRVGDVARVAQFLQIAYHLHQGKAWAMTDLADQYLLYKGLSRGADAAALYTKALELGHVPAGDRLLTLLQNEAAEVFDPDRAADVAAQLNRLSKVSH